MATTSIMPPQQTQSAANMMNQLVGSGAGALSVVATGGLGLKNPNDMYVGLLGSRPVADAIIQKFNLASAYGTTDMTATRKVLASNTQIITDKSGFISISVTDKDKRRAADIANDYTEELRNLTKSLAVTEASQRRLFYEDQLKQSKDALVAAEFTFEQVQQKKGLVQPEEQAKAMIDSLAALRAKVAAKEVELQAERSYSTEQNPDVQLAERELSALQAEVSNLEQSSHSKGFSDLGMQDVPAAGLEYLRAEHELKYQQALFDLLVKQYDAARMDEAKDAAIIQVIEPALEPDRKSSPKRTLIIAGFTLVGLIVGCFLSLILWCKTLVLSHPESVRQLLDLKEAIVGRTTETSIRS
jgi:uncharacterized protein involved in exopolysaccharide biosynthesis